MSEEPKPDLIDNLDAAAISLLKAIGVGGNVANIEGAERPTLIEKVKVFQSVVAWAETRKEIAPAEKKESKFDEVRSRFNGGARERRGTSSASSKKQPHSPLSDDIAAPDRLEAGADHIVRAEPAPGAGLFDS